MTRRPKSSAEGLALSAVRRRSEVTLKQIGAPVGDGCDSANHRRKSKELVTAFYELAIPRFGCWHATFPPSEKTLSWTDPRSCLQSALSASIDRLKTDHVTAEVRNAVPSLESKLLVYYCSLLNFYRWIILSVLKISGVKQSGL